MAKPKKKATTRTAKPGMTAADLLETFGIKKPKPVTPAAAEPEEKIDLSAEFSAALEKLENGEGNLFVTGRAGTGKSTLLRYWRKHTARRLVVLAPTGIAALNVQGQTIHSFFGFSPAETVAAVRRWCKEIPRDDKYAKLDVLVVDEASMVRADLVDCMDAFLRRHGPRAGEPFGGVRLVFFGDLFQLPPVVTDQQRESLSRAYATPFFFSALAFTGLAAAPLETISLTKVYRQRDATFVDLLDAVRTGRATPEHYRTLAARRQADFEPPEESCWVHLTTTNARARDINDTRLGRLPGGVRVFKAKQAGQRPEGHSFPTEEELALKEDAQVMFVANDPERRWVNGTVGRVVSLGAAEDKKPLIRVALPDGEEVEVAPHTWEMYEWEFDTSSGQMGTSSVGQFIQYPLRLAWAITIHKSQGQTFDRLILDLERGTFAAGQLYVALSRCRTLEGLVLKQVVQPRHVIVDPRVVEFAEQGRVTGTLAVEAAHLRETKSVLRAAIEDQRAVRLHYEKPGTPAAWRTVTPVSLGEISFQGSTFPGLRAYCHDTGEQRTYRLDRIRTVEVPEE